MGVVVIDGVPAAVILQADAVGGIVKERIVGHKVAISPASTGPFPIPQINTAPITAHDIVGDGVVVRQDTDTWSRCFRSSIDDGKVVEGYSIGSG